MAAIGTSHCSTVRIVSRIDTSSTGQRHRRQLGDGLVAHDVDHLRPGDLHGAAGTDDAGVGIGDDVGEELGGLRVGRRRGRC